jgi:hypothetical protein
MSKNTRSWIRGLLSAFFSGAAGAIGAMVVDPIDFNFAEPNKLLMVSGWSAAIGVINFLAKSPLPDDDEPSSIISPTTLQFIRKDDKE